MHIVLVQCPPWGTLPPLGTATLKAYLAEHGKQATCIDLNIDYCRERHQDQLADDGGSVYARPDPWASESYDEWMFDFDGEVRFRGALQERPLPIARWVDQILAHEPGAVGFSVQLTNLGVALQVAQEIKRRNASIPVIFGGPNVSQDQKGELALRTGVPNVVVEGEGEATLVELLDRFEAGLDVSDVPGIGLLVNGSATWTERRPQLANVDTLPFPDFSDVDWTQYPNPYEIPIMSSRGCVLDCAFCYETVYWKRFRTQSASRIVDEIEHQIAHHPLRRDVEDGFAQFAFSFADSLVNGHLGGLKRMAELLIKHETGVSWNGQATVNTRMDAEYFNTLVASGCTGLSFGLESGSQPVLDAMGKRFKIDEAAAFFERAHRAGIKVVVNVMVGFPTETRADLTETLRFLRKIQPLLYMVNNVSPTGVTPGSELHKNPEAFGITPADPTRWATAYDLTWSTIAAGDEKRRHRRTQWLHFWMTLMRVPHQQIAPSTGGFARFRRRLQPTPQSESSRWLNYQHDRQPEPLPPGHVVRWRPGVHLTASDVDARINAERDSVGQEPLLLTAIDQLIERATTRPEWATALRPEQLQGVPLADFRDLVETRLSTTLTSSGAEDDDGVVEAVIVLDEPSESGLAGLRILLFPPGEGRADHRIAIFPVLNEQSRQATGVTISTKSTRSS